MAVFIAHQESFAQKVSAFSKAGAGNIFVLSDFDKTLTPAMLQGKKVQSTIAHIRNERYLTKDYASQAHALFEKYHPFEIDPLLSIEEKSSLMEEWWTTHLHLLLRSGMNKKVIEDILAKGLIVGRDGLSSFLALLNKHQVPLVILSAGLSDAIEGFLKKENELYANTHIVSNKFIYDAQGRVIGYQDHPPLHSLNKNGSLCKDKPFFHLIRNRKYILLLGDNVDDLTMAKGLTYDICLSIGFLNEDGAQAKAIFLKKFDVVITEDSSLEPVVDIVRNILEKK
jgi:5'-nucleotidase